jgi:hypothetical protein
LDGIKEAVGAMRCLISMRVLKHRCGAKRQIFPPAVLKVEGERAKRHRLILTLLPLARSLMPIAVAFRAPSPSSTIPLPFCRPLTATARGGSECTMTEALLDKLIEKGYMSLETRRHC